MTNRRRFILAGGAAVLAAGGATWAGVRDMGSMTEHADAVARMRSSMPAVSDKLDLVRYAALAANSHNTQPWQFQLGETRIEILPDLRRRTPAVDPDDHHLFVSLGCAAENLAIAAAARRMGGELSFDPTGDGRIVFEIGTEAGLDTGLFAAIPLR